MQMVIQVLCKKPSPSLRELITKDVRVEKYGLRLVSGKRQGRSPGWAKLRSSEGEHGAINLEWGRSSRTLTCRVVTKNRNKPYKIVGDFIAYLIAIHSMQIVTILISQSK